MIALPQQETDTIVLCEQMRLLDRTMDGYRWLIGDLINAAVDGGLKVVDAARDAQIDNGLASRYRLMSQLYPDDQRQALMDEYEVNWSILNVVRIHATKMARQVGRPADIEDVRQFLDHCSDNAIHTVNHYRRESQVLLGKPKPRKKVATVKLQFRKSFGHVEAFIRGDLPDDFEAGTFEADLYEVSA